MLRPVDPQLSPEIRDSFEHLILHETFAKLDEQKLHA